MIGLDTNILVRYLTHDDPSQTAAAIRVMNSLSSDSPGFLSLIVVAELVWVLTIAYRFRKRGNRTGSGALLRSKELVTERAEIVAQALRCFQRRECRLRGLLNRTLRPRCRMPIHGHIRPESSNAHRYAAIALKVRS